MDQSGEKSQAAECLSSRGQLFRGLHAHTIDVKGRTQCPARFREALQQNAGAVGDSAPTSLMMTTGLDTCLVVYDLRSWQAFEQRLARLSQFDAAVVRLKRIYVASATECEIDRHGRLLIPPALRSYANLQRDIIWAGMVTTCEIWDQSAWESRLAACRDDKRSIAQALTDLGL